MSNFVNYQVEMIPENAGVIDQINKLLISGYSDEATTTKPKKDKPVDKEETNASEYSIEDLKKAAKKAKKEHGEDFAMSTIKKCGVEPATTLGRSMSKISEDLYGTVIAAWQAGPIESDDGLDDDDGFDDDDELGADIDPEAVKIALKAYSKAEGRDEAKAIMTGNGAKALSDVDNCNQEQLGAMMKAMV